MRIIGGEHRGRKLYPPVADGIRPTTDIAKEALFNILNNHFDFDGLSILDLFAGTGSISYEFASRGASEITAVEINYQMADFIRRTGETLGIFGLKVYRTNCFNFLQKPPASYDIVFADPPYNLNGFENVPAMVIENKLCKPGGWFILEHPGNFDFSALPGFYQLRTYGKVRFSIFAF